MRADFTLDAISDLKIAVDEACSELVHRAVADGELVCRFSVQIEQIHFSAQVRTGSPAPPSRDSFGWRVLTALTHAVNARVVPGVDGGHLLRLELVTRRAGAVQL